MVDLHTHILPGMDDGAATADISIAMLKKQAEQGVRAVVLTPHLYRERENVGHFLSRRERAMARLQTAIDALPEAEREQLPRLILGAEVAWRPNMRHWENLESLCIGSTRNLLLELPNTTWNDQVLNTIYNLLNQGITPVLAHLDRYLQPRRRSAVEHVLSMGVPVQISAGALNRPLIGRKLIRFMEQEQNVVLASDCHNMASRLPDMAEGVERLRKKLNQEKVEAILQCGSKLITP